MSSGSTPPQDAAFKLSSNPEPFYTNEDVAVLHNIVLLAEELLPGLPERERLPTNALFGAYYDILPRVGVNADHDSRYARILFKIGGLRGPGTIYEKFEEILSRMGIEIEFDQGLEEQYNHFEQSQADIESVVQEESHDVRDRKRRNSESSAWDVGTDFPQLHGNRQRGASSLHQTIPPRASADDILLRDGKPVHKQPQRPKASQNRLERDLPKHNIRTWLASSQENSRRERERSTSRHKNLQIRRRSHSAKGSQRAKRTVSVESDDLQTPSEVTAVTSVQEQQTQDNLKFVQRDSFTNIPGGLMQVKASLILQHHLGFLAKRQLRLWRDKALQLRDSNVKKDLIAIIHDRNALLQQALETWHNQVFERRQIAATERFFSHLERRSERIRDLYLLDKAFTHWRVCAFDELERTSIARRHIVRSRTFNAWRDITAINELKVRRQVIKKFFTIWKRYHLTIESCSIAAVQKFEGNLVGKSYRKWIQKGWDIKAALWWAEGTKQRVLFRWRSTLRSILNGCNIAEEHKRLKLLWKTLHTFRARTDERIKEARLASNLYELSICSSALRRWRGEMRIIPAKIAVQTDVDSRLLREKFETWLHRSRAERGAVAIDRLRIFREAWTTWRHKVRFQLTRARVNDRVVQEAMYKWILRGRIICTGRSLRRKVLRESLQIWACKTVIAREQRWIQEDMSQDYDVRNAYRVTLSRWQVCLKSQLQRERDASGLYNSNLLQRLLSQWSTRAQHLCQLHQWSHAAEFYFLASRTLKRWKFSTQSVKREKRKAAYAEVRRIVKMNLALGVLITWRQQGQRVLVLQVQAKEMIQNKNVIMRMSAFDRWRTRTEELGELELSWREKILKKQFLVWNRRSSAFRDLEMEAVVNYQERRQTRAVKKWNLLTLQVRSQSRYASEIREKNLKRIFRKIFSYWHQRILQKRPLIHLRTYEQALPGLLDATVRAEAWSDFGDEPQAEELTRRTGDANPSTPFPGYSSTPSKRLERVSAAVARFSSTTPRAPLSTPFERHLRAQYSEELFISARKPFERSKLGLGADFKDITRKGRVS